MSDPNSFKYHAFISYSHRDKIWGDWLHRGLETYRVPRALVNRATTRGEAVPARIFPVFRDREELPTAVDLGTIINQALEQSRYLIVICSPASARSQWVNQEILAFKRLGRENRVLAIIVDGEPNAADGKPGFSVDDECFPPALKFKLGPDGHLSDERTEPIAADARSHADGKPHALLKLLAGVLGVNYDDLRQRQAERLRRRRQSFALAATAVLAGAAFVYAQFIAEQRERAFQGALAELGRARQLLSDQHPELAATSALSAIQAAEQAHRPLEPAWWVMRRALDANRAAQHWNADPDTIDETGFDRTGTRLLTFSRGSNAARIWSVPDGNQVASLTTDKRIDFATVTASGTEVVTIHAWQIEPTSADDPGSTGVDLVWWNILTGERLRTATVPNASFFSLRTRSVDAPAWLAMDDFRRDVRSLILVRLSDGWAEQHIPLPTENNWAIKPVFIPDCGVVLLVNPSEGVTVLPLGSDGPAHGPLEGVTPAEKLQLTHLVSSVDRTAFAALVWDGDHLLASGVWRASDGHRLASTDLRGEALSSATWIAAAGPSGLTGHNTSINETLAPALGRQSIESPIYDADGFIWHETADASAPIAATLGNYGEAQINRPADDWRTTLPDKASSLALSPDGSLLAAGDNLGTLTLWRTEAPLSIERDLPARTAFAQVVAESPASDGSMVWLRPSSARFVRWDIAARRVVLEIDGAEPKPDSWMKLQVNPVANWLTVSPALPLFQAVPEGWETLFYDLTTGQLLGRRPAADYVLAPQGRRALGPGRHGWAVVSANTNALTTTDLQPTTPLDPAWATAAAFSPDGTRVNVARGDGQIEIFASDSGTSQRVLRFAEDQHTSINHLTISPDGQWALLATYNTWWRVNLSSGQSELAFAHEDQPETHWTFLDDGKLLVGAARSLIKWWSFPDLQPLGQVKVGGTSADVRLSPNGDELLIKPDWEDTLTIVRRSTGQVRARLNGLIALDPSNRLAAVNASVDGQDSLRVMRLADSEILAERVGLSTSAAAFAADGSRLLFEQGDRIASFALPFDADELRRRATALVRAETLSDAAP